ncbi:hypothetical protein BH23CHL8_BH23CHL8_02220 [soil metagenome]
MTPAPADDAGYCAIPIPVAGTLPAAERVGAICPDHPRSLIGGTTYGLVKLVFRRAGRRLVGVHIVGEEAAELIHVGQAVIHAGETIDRFIHATFNLPTHSEAYKFAAYDGLQRLSREVCAEAFVAGSTARV